MSLMFSSSRISFFLMMLVAVPLIVKTPYILSIWLGETPQYTATFMRLVIIVAMIDALGHPPTTAICATGRIKWYHITVSTFLLLNLPISYLLLLKGNDPYVVFMVSIGVSSFAQAARICFMKYIHGMDILKYCKDVLFRIILVSIPAFACSFYGASLLSNTFFSFCLFIIYSCFITLVLVYSLGLIPFERRTVNRICHNFFKVIFYTHEFISKK